MLLSSYYVRKQGLSPQELLYFYSIFSKRLTFHSELYGLYFTEISCVLGNYAVSSFVIDEKVAILILKLTLIFRLGSGAAATMNQKFQTSSIIRGTMRSAI
jgi:hypothetical protein